MGYQDPRDAYRAARYAWKAQRYAWKAQRRAQRQAYRDARRFYRHRYGRPGGSIVGGILLVLVIVYVISHAWAWLATGAVVLVLAGLAFWLVSSGMLNNWFSGYAQTPPPQQPQQQEEPPPQSYAQGYSSQSYQEGGRQYSYPPQSPSVPPQRDEEPQAQYPEQMPPMQQ